MRTPALLIFAAVFGVGLIWSLYTNHAWEDYYITYRASKNLATGHGLVFTPGEKVHSFTSPLGVLLPALACRMTGNSFDYGALWIFRLLSIAAYATAAVTLWRLARSLRFHSLPVALLVVAFAIDAKTVDFSTNGMETGFLLLFFGWSLLALLTDMPRRSFQLGLAWSGLMWTRPDSCIYIALLAGGSLLFSARGSAERKAQLRLVVGASVITTVLYSPWIIWAWSYYGSPVPNTIIAKGLFQPPFTLSSFAEAVIQFPVRVVSQRDVLTTTFMPAYSYNTGWPKMALIVSYGVSALCLVAWLIPTARAITRLASFVFFWGQFYLTTYVQFPVPWYIPTLTLFAIIVVTSSLDQLLQYKAGTADGLARFFGSVTSAIGLLLLGGVLTLSLQAAQQLKAQQAIIEHGQRREIGRWLRSHGQPGDSVFLEPLGYIGFYSNLKMLDYPGLASREVIAARQRAKRRDYPGAWPELIIDLVPTWLVLRPYEAEQIRRRTPELLTSLYALAQTFDVSSRVNAVRTQGKGYLLNDAVFEVYRRQDRIRHAGQGFISGPPIKVAALTLNEAWDEPAKDAGMKLIAHAPSRLRFTRPANARRLSGNFGIEEGAFESYYRSTDGASFRITFVPTAGDRQELFRQDLNPRDRSDDRGLKSFSVELPEAIDGQVELVVTAGDKDDKSFDWTYWSLLRFEFPSK